jgi:hypothetical protein
MATLTQLNDGFGFDGVVATTQVNEEFDIAIDSAIKIKNTSLTDSYDVMFNLNYSNSVNADGSDSFIDSELTLDIDGVEAYFSDLVSDTQFGDSDQGSDLGTFGADLSDVLSTSFVVSVAADSCVSLMMEWLFFGGQFDSGIAEGDFSVDLQLASVSSTNTVPVSEPSVFALLSSGLLLFAWRRRSA